MSIRAEQSTPESDWIILVVDAVRENIQALEAILSGAGFKVITATTGAGARERIGAKLPDLVLLNLMMPDALDLCRDFKSDAATRKIPFIFLTSRDDSTAIEQAFAAGAADYASLPARSEELLARVRAHVELKKAREALGRYGQRLSELNDEKNEFLGIVAHDLRSPLSNIITSAGMALAEGGMDRTQIDEFLAIIQSSAQHMIRLVENLMDVNAIEQGRLKMEIAPCELGELLRAVANSYQSKARAKEQLLRVTEETGPLVAMADPHLTIQVFDNLVSNAIKYSPAGKRIEVRLLRHGEVIRCEVEDQGPGLTKDDLDQVFGKFARLSAKPTAGEPSTGLGLSIVKRIVEAGGGKVWCESEPGAGAKFIVEIPAAPNA